MASDLTESSRILSGALSQTIVDASGRQLEVKKLSRREIMRFMRLWGTPSNVESWFGLEVMAASVRAIDGRPLAPPDTAAKAEQIAEMLGDEGGKAVEDWFVAQDTAALDTDEAKN